MKRFGKSIIAIAICLLVISSYIIFPGTKTGFPCYALFRATADEEVYLKRLPASAYDIKYYVHEEFALDKNGYRMKVASEDYEQVKRELYDGFNSEYSTGTYNYDGVTKRMLSSEEMELMHVEFLEELLADDSADTYYILTEIQSEGEKFDVYWGVICNDETYEIIEFTYYQMKTW